jgi:hypothetical protein
MVFSENFGILLLLLLLWECQRRKVAQLLTFLVYWWGERDNISRWGYLGGQLKGWNMEWRIGFFACLCCGSCSIGYWWLRVL